MLNVDNVAMMIMPVKIVDVPVVLQQHELGMAC